MTPTHVPATHSGRVRLRDENFDASHSSVLDPSRGRRPTLV